MSVCFWKYWALQVGSSWVEIQQLSWVELHTPVTVERLLQQLPKYVLSNPSSIMQVLVKIKFIHEQLFIRHIFSLSLPPPKSEAILEHFKWLKLAENEKKMRQNGTFHESVFRFLIWPPEVPFLVPFGMRKKIVVFCSFKVKVVKRCRRCISTTYNVKTCQKFNEIAEMTKSWKFPGLLHCAPLPPPPSLDEREFSKTERGSTLPPNIRLQS